MRRISTIFLLVFIFASCENQSDIDGNKTNVSGLHQPMVDTDFTPEMPDNFLPRPELIFAEMYDSFGGTGGGPGRNHFSECSRTLCNGPKHCVTFNEPLGTLCGQPRKDLCDAPDTCDGNGNCVDFKYSGLKCKEGNGECDPPDYCNGLDDHCPEQIVSAGVKCGPDVDAQWAPCDRRDECDGDGHCQDLVHNSTKLCETGAEQDCNPLDHCNGVDKTCPVTFAPPGKSCGEILSDGPCDLPDECDGAGVCVDIKHFGGMVCDYSHGACQPDSICNGISSSCPINLAPAGTACGALNQGTCDALGYCRDQNQQLVADNCPTGTGSEPDNDLDTYSTACDCDDNDPEVYLGTTCTAEAQACFTNICSLDLSNEPACTPVAVSDGTACTNDTSSNACAEGAFCSLGDCITSVSPPGTVCRASAGSCDITEYCDGNSTSCPSNSLEPAGTACGNMENNSCVATQTCDGQDVNCDSPVVYLDGLESSSSCPSSTPDSICSVGVEFCIDDDLTDATTNPKAILVGNESQESEEFGASVSIHGQYAIVGVPHYNTTIGAVFVYHFSSPDAITPTLINTVLNPGRAPNGSVPQEDFGRSVSLYNMRFAVGAPLADAYYDENTSDSDCDMGNKNNDAGAVYIFQINNDNSVTTLQRVQGSNIGFPQDQENNCQLEVGADDVLSEDCNLGYDVAIGANYLVAGAPHNVNNATGFAYVYYLNGNTWQAVQQISSSLSDGGAQFGTSVAISPDQKKIAIGAPFHDTNHDNNGNMQTFLSDGAGGMFSGPKENITGLNGGDRYGFDVSITDTLLAVGAPEFGGNGLVYLYQVNNDATLGLDAAFYPTATSTDDQFFGATVSLDRSHDGHSLIVGAPQFTIKQGDGVSSDKIEYGYFAYYEARQTTSAIVPGDFSLVSAQTGYDYNTFDNGLTKSCQQNIQLGSAVGNDSNRIIISAVNYIDTNSQSCVFSGSAGFANPVGAISIQFFPY